MGRPDKMLLTAWLLLLLERCGSHGYGLQRELRARNLEPDPAALYRLLRSLESEGCVASSWATPVDGPARRLYRLTLEGRASLDHVADMIKVARERHDLFLCAETDGLDALTDLVAAGDLASSTVGSASAFLDDESATGSAADVRGPQLCDESSRTDVV